MINFKSFAQKIIFLVLTLFCVISNAANTKKTQVINYKNMAITETKIWQSYYKKDTDALLKNTKILLSEQYGISNSEEAQKITEKFVLAYMKFLTMPQHSSSEKYNSNVLPSVIIAYQALKESINALWNPQKAAEADLSWWVARRQNNTLNPEIVSKKMVVLFYTLYGQQDNHHFARAAYLRSVAGRYRDQCQDAWSGIDSEDWNVVTSLLEESYRELYQGIISQK